MKYISKVMTVLIIVILTLSTTVLAVSTSRAIGADTESLTRMQQLGLIEKLSNTNDDIYKALTREDFAKILVKMLDLGEMADSLNGQSNIADVKVADQNAGYINVVINKGYLTVMTDKKFHPRDGVTYAQFCTAVVKTLGYGDSDLTGVWPQNYITKAKSLKLADGMNLKNGDGIARWAAAVMLDRLQNTNIKKASTQDTAKTLAASIGMYADVSVLGESDTMSELEQNEVLTNQGTYYQSDLNQKLSLGTKYRVSINENKLEKVYYSMNTTKKISVNTNNGTEITYHENGKSVIMTLPTNTVYYYKGVKQSYVAVGNVLQSNSTIIFAYNDDKIGYAYAVIVDPVYSKPQTAYGIKAGITTIGAINLESGTKILKNGAYIDASEIQDGDIVYQISTIDSTNKYIYIVDNKLEGKLKGILPNRLYPKSVQIDDKTYELSKDMDMTQLTSDNSMFKIGNTVQIMLGYDGKVADISKTIKLGKTEEYVYIGNAKTNEGLQSNQILTDKGLQYLSDSGMKLELGTQYMFYLYGGKIEKVDSIMNQVKSVVVKNVNEYKITFGPSGVNEMNLPDTIIYYYKGEKLPYATVKNVLQSNSTIIFGYNDDKSGYAYAVIIDPVYSKPQTVHDIKTGVTAIVAVGFESGMKILKNGAYIAVTDIQDGDIVYKVSTIDNTDNYIYVVDNKLEGKLNGVLPNRLYPKSIQVDDKSYELSKDMDVAQLTSDNSMFKIGDTVQIMLGYDGKVADISKTIKLGKTEEYIFIGNTKTNESLQSNQIMTDKGLQYLNDTGMKLVLGARYRFYLYGGKIEKIDSAMNEVKNVVVKNANEYKITYGPEGVNETMPMPDTITYYYNGEKIPYTTVKSLLQVNTTIIFGYNETKSGFDYAVIVDPIYGKPEIANNIKIGDMNIGSISLLDWRPAVYNGEYINPYMITNGQVVYQVTDLYNTSKYILVLDGMTSGKLTAILPSRVLPKIIQINGKNYDISYSMDLEKLTNINSTFKIGDTVQITTGSDGKVINLDYPQGQDNANYAYVLSTSLTYDNGNPVYGVKLLKADGTSEAYKTSTECSSLRGTVVTFKELGDDMVSVIGMTSTDYPDLQVNKEEGKIGDLYVASNIRIFNVINDFGGIEANAKVISWNDLYSGIIQNGKIKYMSQVGVFGDVNVLLVKDLYNEGKSFGLVKSTSTTSVKAGNKSVTVYNYVVKIGAKEYTFSSSDAYNLGAMSVASVELNNDQIILCNGPVTEEVETTAIQAIDSIKIKVKDKIYKYSNDIKVYYKNSAGEISTKLISEIDTTLTYTSVKLYIDRSLYYGGKVKTIVITE